MAKKDLGSAGELFPQSVFIVGNYGEDGTPNAMDVARGGERTRNEVCVNIGDHKTTENIVARGAFTVAPADAAHVAEAPSRCAHLSFRKIARAPNAGHQQALE